MKLRCLFIMAVLLAAVARGADTPKTTDEIMKFASEKLGSYETWSAEMKQSINMMGVPMTLQGRMWFKKPQKTRTEMQMPMVGALGKMTMVMGGDGWMWQEMDMLGKKQVMKTDMAMVASNLSAKGNMKLDGIQNADPSRQWDYSRKYMNFTLGAATTIDGQPSWLLEAVWKPETIANPALAPQVASCSKMRMYVGQQDGFTRRIEQFDKDGKPGVTIEFTKLKFNEKLDDSMFQYKPPAGVEAIDVTEISLQMMQQGGMPSGLLKP